MGMIIINTSPLLLHWEICIKKVTFKVYLHGIITTIWQTSPGIFNNIYFNSYYSLKPVCNFNKKEPLSGFYILYSAFLLYMSDKYQSNLKGMLPITWELSDSSKEAFVPVMDHSAHTHVPLLDVRCFLFKELFIIHQPGLATT